MIKQLVLLKCGNHSEDLHPFYFVDKEGSSFLVHIDSRSKEVYMKHPQYRDVLIYADNFKRLMQRLVKKGYIIHDPFRFTTSVEL